MNSPQAVLQKALELAPEVRLSSSELYFPASVEWYLARVSMMYPQLIGSVSVPVVITTDVNDQTIATQSYKDPVTSQTLSSGDPLENTPFYLKIVDPTTETGQVVVQNGAISLDNPECYFSYSEAPSRGFADFVYGFFYAYNGLVGNDPGTFGWHEADWEHVVVRVTQDLSTVLGIYYQAHRQVDPWSHWYFPPGTEGVSCYTVNADGRPIVYSSAQGHSSYTAPDDYYYGVFRGYDHADGTGLVWSTWENLQQFSGSTPWMAYSGYWGDGGWDGYGPVSPGYQGWLQTRTDGPSVYTAVSVNTTEAAHQDSRVSANFTLNQPGTTVEWKITDLPDESLASAFTFAVMEDKSGKDQPRLTNVTDGTTSAGVLTKINPNKMYIGRLTYTDPTTKTVYTGLNVFKQLNITAFTVTAASVST